MKKLFPLIALLFAFPLAGLCQSDPDTLNKLDLKGLKHGYWKKSDGDTLRYEGRFEHGVPVGEFIYYYYDKTVKAKTQYSENGTVANTVMYFPNGSKLSEGRFINQKREGLWKNYDGYDACISAVEFKNGEKNGKSIRYYQTGIKLEVANYINGKLEGKYAQYFPDSVPKIKGTYVGGKRNGIFVFYHANGLVYTSGKFVEGLREGDWVINDESGKIIVKEKYEKGEVVSREVFQKDKDPLELQKKDSDLQLQNKGKSSTNNGIDDPRYDGY